MAQNTISDELNRLIQAKAGIKSALEEKGLTIGDSSTLDEFPGLIQEMEVGGGGGGYDVSTVIDLIEGDLTELTIPTGTTSIRLYGFYNFNNLQKVIIPDTVTSIGIYAFQSTGLTNIVLPNSITSLGMMCFSQNRQLTNIILSNQITSLPQQTFWQCDKLQTIVIPATVTSIGQMCFSNCTKLNNIAFLNVTPPTLANANIFNNTNALQNIYVKNEAVDTYKNAGGNWTSYTDKIKPLASMSYDDTTYTVTASGRDNVELYVDASLCDSSVYTFVPDTIDVSHNITVKSVDPSLGILDTVSQEILIEGETQELKNYFALTAVQNSSVGFEKIDNNVDLKYSSDGVNWSNMISGNAGKLNLPAGETLYFKGNNPSTPQGLGYFQLTGQVDASGNAMSLIYDDNFENQLTAPNYAFQSLFLSCTALNSVEDLLLPATTLGEGCYRSLFYGCTNITKAPVLPATTLVRYCYASMFSGCSSLNYIKAMFTSEPSDSALSGWTSNVANTGTFVMNAAAEWNPEEYDLEIGDLVWDWTIEKVNA